MKEDRILSIYRKKVSNMYTIIVTTNAHKSTEISLYAQWTRVINTNKVDFSYLIYSDESIVWDSNRLSSLSTHMHCKYQTLHIQ
jgi:hypothetical protein